MSEPAKENPKTSRRSKRRPAMEPLGWDEIVSQPGMGGYLSFLNGPIPLPHLQGSAAALAPDPGFVSSPGVDTTSEVISSPEIESKVRSVKTPEGDSIPEVISDPASASGPGVVQVAVPIPDPETITTPGVMPLDRTASAFSDPGADTYPGVVTSPPTDVSIGVSEPGSTPEVVLIPAITAIQRLRIRRCSATHDGHSLGEEVLYQALWKAAQPESGDSRTIVIGWRGMSQLCRMTPKNCKINTQRLIRKLALEIVSTYNTPESIGTTYRVYSDSSILQRRRQAGLEWVVRSRGVDFVDPATGSSIMPICAHTH